MRLPYGPNQLRLIPKGSSQPPPVQGDRGVALYRGVSYPPQQWQQWISSSALEADAMASDFLMTTDCGQSLPLQDGSSAYIWDSLSHQALRENECQLLNASLEELTIEEVIGGSLLAITPRFTLRYKTAAYAAQLGEIRLVTSQRYLTDEEGEHHTLLNTEEVGEMALYLEGPNDTAIVRQQTPWQSRDHQKDYCFDYRIDQGLQRSWRGRQVHSVTVLEQFTSYFMQRAVASVPSKTFWVPAYSPVTWGWSLRVAYENNEWVIIRRKLVPPVVGHDGWQLPQWRGNTMAIANDYDGL